MNFPGIVLLVSLLTVVLCNTLYDLTNGKIYIHLANNDIVMLEFNIDGRPFSIGDGQEIHSLGSSPPQNTELFLFGNDLYGFNENNNKMVLLKFDNSSSTWQNIDLDFDDIDNSQFYKYANYLTSPVSSQLFIYGGQDHHGNASNRLLSLDFTTFKFCNISTATKPQYFYGASNLLAPNPQTQLLIGGESNNGWLNMYQLATWDFSSGWSSVLVNKDNSTVINSRKFSTLLPIFSPLNNNNESTVINDYKVSQVMILGGLDNDDQLVSPPASMLVMDTNNWYFQGLPEFNISAYLGYATVFNNFITISRPTSVKRSNNYQMNLFDLQFNKVQQVTIPKSQSQIIAQNETAKHSIELKAILATVIPVSVVAIVIAVVYYIIKKKKKTQLQRELKDLNYQYENYFNIETEKKRQSQPPQQPPNHHGEHLTLLYNDSSSTLDVNSIDSWVKKRQEFDSSRIRENPFMQSQETLHDKEMSPQLDDESPNMVSGGLQTPEPLRTITKLNRSMVKLRKSMSFSNLSPVKLYNHSLLPDYESQIESQIESAGNSPIKVSPNEPEYPNPDTLDLDSDDQSDFNQSIANIDVQVLVSSKRRSILKVMNPDLSTIDETTLRQRVPSADSQAHM